MMKLIAVNSECPGCGEEGKSVKIMNNHRFWCENDGCRVNSFNPGDC